MEAARNLKLLGEALLMYSGDNGGFFTVDSATPDAPLSAQDVLDDASVYACPTSSIDAKPGDPYRYVSPTSQDTATATATPPGAATTPDNAWMNALFIDGHAEKAAADPTPDKD